MQRLDKQSKSEEFSSMSARFALTGRFNDLLLKVNINSMSTVQYSNIRLRKHLRATKKKQLVRFVLKMLILRMIFCSTLASVLALVELSISIVSFNGLASKLRRKLWVELFTTTLKNSNVKSARLNFPRESKRKRIVRFSCFLLKNLQETIQFCRELVKRRRV